MVRHGDGPQAANYVIGEIVHLRIADSALRDDELFDTAGAGAVRANGRSEWATLCPGMYSNSRGRQPDKEAVRCTPSVIRCGRPHNRQPQSTFDILHRNPRSQS